MSYMIAWSAGAGIGMALGAMLVWHMHTGARERAKAHREALALLRDIMQHAALSRFSGLPAGCIRRFRALRDAEGVAHVGGR